MHSPSGALSARGISNCNREDLGKTLADIEGPIDKSPGTKEALAVRLRKLAIDGEKTLQGTCVPAELPGVVLSAFEHRLDRTARTWLSFIGAPESDRLP
jgi:hypothetical protein